MDSSFDKFVFSLNHTSGRKWWWLVFGFGWMLILGWIIAILPWVDLFMPGRWEIGHRGPGAVPTMIVYGSHFTSQGVIFYVIGVLVGFVVVVTGVASLLEVAWNFALGEKFRLSNPRNSVWEASWRRGSRG